MGVRRPPHASHMQAFFQFISQLAGMQIAPSPLVGLGGAITLVVQNWPALNLHSVLLVSVGARRLTKAIFVLVRDWHGLLGVAAFSLIDAHIVQAHCR